ncbi:MAG: GxxExxY protein [Saprospiraceae bacterium]|nr:GxxExxY protein [Saprospiraceae bacterium]
MIGACLEVYNTLGTGFLEIIYKDALEIEFKRRGIPYVREKTFPVFYKGIDLKKSFDVDFFVFEKINLEVKATSGLAESHYLQTKNYCACSNQRLGLLVNFGEPSLVHKRILSGY